jgi:hypothetical protein
VRTLHEKFPDAKFINLVRNPMRVIPSSVSMFSNHWKTYGDPEGEYPQPGPATILEHARHWYVYPHQYLKNLPPDQYKMVRYKDLVADPQGTVESIYEQFGIEMTAEYRQILHQESEKAKRYKSSHQYSLEEMGLDQQEIAREFQHAVRDYDLDIKE